MVTIEDIIEELVGDTGSHDRVIKEMEETLDREYLMSGSANIDKVFEISGYRESGGCQYLERLDHGRAGQIPKEGDSFVSDGMKVVVL